MHELRWNVEGRQQHIPLQLERFTAVHDVPHGGKRLGHIRKKPAHFLRGFQIELVIGQAKSEFPPAPSQIPLGLADVRRILDAQQDVVRIGFVACGVVAVVGGHETDVVLATQPEQEIVDHLLFLDAVAVELRIEVRTEVFFPPEEGVLGLAVPHIEEQARHLTEQAAGEHNQVLLVFEQLRSVDSRNVIEAVGVGQGTQLGQPVVACPVLGDQHNRVAVVFLASVGMVAAHIEFGADDGFDAGLVGRPDKLEGPHHVAVVGHGQGGHAQFRSFGGQHLDTRCGLQHAELAVYVQVAEWNVLQRGDVRGGLRWRGRCLRLDLWSGLVKVGRLQLWRLVLDPIPGGKPFPLDDPTLDQGKKALGRGVDVIGGIVRVPEAHAEQLFVQLGEGWPFEFAAPASRDGTEFGGLVLGVDEGLVRDALGRRPEADPLRPHDVDIELDVVAHDVRGLVEVPAKLLHHLGEGKADFRSPLRGDAVHLGGVVRDGKSIRLHDAVAAGNEFAVGGVQLPGELDQSGPILAVCERRIPVPGQAGGLRVVNENHGGPSSWILPPD